MNDQTLEAECFGGTYKAKVKNPSNNIFVIILHNIEVLISYSVQNYLLKVPENSLMH